MPKAKTWTLPMPPVYSIGDVLVGTGLQNAGRSHTVLAISASTQGRVYLEEHLTGRKFWTFDRYYRLA